MDQEFIGSYQSGTLDQALGQTAPHDTGLQSAQMQPPCHPGAAARCHGQSSSAYTAEDKGDNLLKTQSHVHPCVNHTKPTFLAHHCSKIYRKIYEHAFLHCSLKAHILVFTGYLVVHYPFFLNYSLHLAFNVQMSFILLIKLP